MRTAQDSTCGESPQQNEKEQQQSGGGALVCGPRELPSAVSLAAEAGARVPNGASRRLSDSDAPSCVLVCLVVVVVVV